MRIVIKDADFRRYLLKLTDRQPYLRGPNTGTPLKQAFPMVYQVESNSLKPSE